MDKVEHPEQVHFLIEKGRRDSARIAESILKIIKSELIGKEFDTEHGKVEIKLFSDIKRDEETDKPQFGFDATGNFGHIEFFIQQTGWGR